MSPTDKKIHQDIDTAFAVAGWASCCAVALLWLAGIV
jgi:hypothetical protein